MSTFRQNCQKFSHQSRSFPSLPTGVELLDSNIRTPVDGRIPQSNRLVLAARGEQMRVGRVECEVVY